MAAPASGRESPRPAYQSAIAPKMAESATRSIELSRNAPHELETPRCRAMRPSSMSENTNSVIAIVPQKKTPGGKKATAAADTPTVPATVITSGDRLVRASRLPSGSRIRAICGRAFEASMVLFAVPSLALLTEIQRSRCIGPIHRATHSGPPGLVLHLTEADAARIVLRRTEEVAR